MRILFRLSVYTPDSQTLPEGESPVSRIDLNLTMGKLSQRPGGPDPRTLAQGILSDLFAMQLRLRSAKINRPMLPIATDSYVAANHQGSPLRGSASSKRGASRVEWRCPQINNRRSDSGKRYQVKWIVGNYSQSRSCSFPFSEKLLGYFCAKSLFKCCRWLGPRW